MVLNLRSLVRAALGLNLIVSGTVATPIRDATAPGTACKTIDHRKEWRDMSVEQRLGYISAVHCLHSLPPRDTSNGATSRYEEFQATHILLTDRVHSVGHFLPWHRHLGTLYGKALREECGYEGPTAYWDWTRDAAAGTDFLKSPILDPVTGFGGDGVAGTYTLPPDPNNESEVFTTPSPSTLNTTDRLASVRRRTLPPPPPIPVPNPVNPRYKGCVQDGPFAQDKWTVHLGPGRMRTAHCLVRGIQPELVPMMLSGQNVQRALGARSFEEFRLIIDSFQVMLHGGGHAVIGGEMTNQYSAGADPLFYLHHAMIDKIWWDWQNADLERRVTDVSGFTTQGGIVATTLDFEMDFPALDRT